MQHGSVLHLRGQKLRLMPVALLFAFALSFTQIPTAYALEYYPACNNAASFQNAVKNANQSGEDDYIGLSGEGCTYTLTETLVILNDGVLTIEGNGAVISGNLARRIFHVQSGATLTLNNMTITQGKNVTDIGFGGAIGNSSGTVTLNNVIVTQNSALFGGGIANNGTLTLNHSTVSHNRAYATTESEGKGGGIHHNNGLLTLNHSVVSGNLSDRHGGGISINNGNITITNSGISYNYTFGESDLDDGGGIYNGGTLKISGSSIYNNVARGQGGGLINFGTTEISGSTFTQNEARYGGGILNQKNLSVTNSTLYANKATDGGGINNLGALTLSNSTLVDNTAQNYGGSLINLMDGSVLMVNTILAGSTVIKNCANFGAIISGSTHNLVQDGSCDFPDSLSGPPGLGNLTGNPGYFPLLAGSPAIDARDDDICTTVDQRGAERPMDGNGDGKKACDIGAFEADTVPVIPSEELLVNGGFEFKTPTNAPKLAPWKLTKGTGDKIRCDKTLTRTYDGACAFMFKGGPSENVTLTQKVGLTSHTFTAGDKLRLSLRVKAPNTSTKGKIKLQVKFSDSSAPQQIVLPLGKTSGYVELADEITLQNGEVSQIRLQINHKSRSGKVYLDAVSLLQIKAPQPLTSSQLIPLPEAPPADMRSNGS